MSAVRALLSNVRAIALAMAFVPAAFAQGQRSSLDVYASTGVPEFKDPKTGQVWTPENVGRDGRPLKPDDKAFDPRAQVVPITGIREQRVRGRPVGAASATAGPTVPLVSMDSPSLRAVPGQNWQVVLYLDNNSGKPADPVIECRFSNAGNTVMETRAIVEQMAPGVRQGLLIYGPGTGLFVDRALCRVTSP